MFETVFCAVIYVKKIKTEALIIVFQWMVKVFWIYMCADYIFINVTNSVELKSTHK